MAPRRARRTTALHYTWWVGHPSVTPERAVAEADVDPGRTGRALRDRGHFPGADRGEAGPPTRPYSSPARRPRLRGGAALGSLGAGPADRLRRRRASPGEVAEEGLLPPRARRARAVHRQPGPGPRRTRGVDRAARRARRPRGAVAGRRALALVTDRAGRRAGGGRDLHGEGVSSPADHRSPRHRRRRRCPPSTSTRPTPGRRPPPTCSRPLPAAVPLAPTPSALGTAAVSAPGTRPPWGSSTTGAARRPRDAQRLVSSPRPRPPPAPARSPPARGRERTPPGLSGARRNVVAAGAGALLAVVLGTVVTLGAKSDDRAPRPGSQNARPRTTTTGDALDPATATIRHRPAKTPQNPARCRRGRAVVGNPSRRAGGLVEFVAAGPPSASDDPSTHQPSKHPTSPSPTHTHTPSPTPTQTSPDPTPTGPTGEPTGTAEPPSRRLLGVGRFLRRAGDVGGAAGVRQYLAVAVGLHVAVGPHHRDAVRQLLLGGAGGAGEGHGGQNSRSLSSWMPRSAS